uniref:Uncharacterized protein n=1 Tax=Daphnia galeata TaxID=27404 RepID=A0A8J2RDS8_9CRUS|nr:unnamed protein product [Daphnia galeata]
MVMRAHSQSVEKPTHSLNAEVVDMEENGDFVYSNFEKEVLPEVPCTPSLKRVSFGSEQFDLNRTEARKKHLQLQLLTLEIIASKFIEILVGRGGSSEFCLGYDASRMP